MRLRLLSYNIAVGIQTKNYAGYLTGGWQHVLPFKKRLATLNEIACFIGEFDIVALQEVDGGSLRSSGINQAEFLATRAGFPFWHHQVNRDFGRFAKQSNAFLSAYRPHNIINHKLPGLLPGRGAIVVEYQGDPDPLLVVVAHLALGKRSREQQIAYISEVIQQYKHVIIMGDLNCTFKPLFQHEQLRALEMTPVPHAHTFPSWQPKRSLDHILVSSSIRVNRVDVLQQHYSDHLPVAVEITLPTSLV